MIEGLDLLSSNELADLLFGATGIELFELNEPCILLATAALGFEVELSSKLESVNYGPLLKAGFSEAIELRELSESRNDFFFGNFFI